MIFLFHFWAPYPLQIWCPWLWRVLTKAPRCYMFYLSIFFLWFFLLIFETHSRSFVPDCSKFLPRPPGLVVSATRTKFMLQSCRHHHCQCHTHSMQRRVFFKIHHQILIESRAQYFCWHNYHVPCLTTAFFWIFPIFLLDSFQKSLPAGHIFLKLDIGEVLA